MRKSSLDRMNKGILSRLGVPISDARGGSDRSGGQGSGYWKITVMF